MLNIKTDNPDFEWEIKQTFGNDTQSLPKAFADFPHQRQIRHEIELSIKQLEQDQGIDMNQAVAEIRDNYDYPSHGL